jgi:monothiol glutaredoxin
VWRFGSIIPSHGPKLKPDGGFSAFAHGDATGSLARRRDRAIAGGKDSDKFTGFFTELHPSMETILMDVIQRIESQLAENPVILYMKGTPAFPQCGFSGRASANPATLRGTLRPCEHLRGPGTQGGLKSYSNWPTYPQLYVSGELIGGCDIMMELLEKGELQTLLEGAQSTQS